MKPLSLTVKNFGPYINETIDFTRFDEASLFLITGKTGAGKTTIFDGMSYALFGESSGKLRLGKEMRSTFAEPSEETTVTFLFSHGDMLYEITRKPEQELYKKRGEGIRTQPAKISLIIKSPEGKELREYTKRKEADLFIQDLLHLDAAQFSQIVLLPQGEFRTFLVANSNEKEKVLRRLFGTQLYQRLNEELKLRSKIMNQKIEQTQQKIDLKLEQIIWIEEPVEALTAEAKIVHLAEQQTKQEILQKELFKEITALKEKKQQLEQKQYAAEEQIKRREKYQELLTQETDMEKRLPEIQKLREKVGNLQWAKQYAAFFEETKDKEIKINVSSQQVLQIEEELASQQEQLFELQHQEKKLKLESEENEKLQQEVVELGWKLPLYKEREMIEDQIKAVTNRQSNEEYERLKKELLLLEKEQEQHQQNTTKLQKLEKEFLIKEQQKKNWELLASDWLSADNLKRQLLSGEEREKEYNEQLLLVKERMKKQQELLAMKKSDWAKMQISQLSLLLVDGEPCPVCGAVEHPVKGEHIEYSFEEIRQAEEELLLAEKLEKEQMNELSTLQADKQALNNQLSEVEQQLNMKIAALKMEITKLIDWNEEETAIKTVIESNISELEEQLDLLTKELGQIQHAEKQLVETKAKIAEISAAKDILEKQISEEEKQKMTLAGSLEAVLKQIEPQKTAEEQAQRKEKLETILGDWQEKCQRVEKELAEMKEYSEKKQDEKKQLVYLINEQKQSVESLQKQLEKSLQDQQIDLDVLELSGLLEELPKLEELRLSLNKFDQEKEKLGYQLQELSKQIQAVDNEKNSSLDQIVELLAVLNQDLQNKEGHYYQQREQQMNNELLKKDVTEMISAIEKQWEEAAALQQLSETINGNNPQKTSLERYVLQTYLEEVLKVANERLRLLTNSRYQFELNRNKNSYKNQTGLEINIYDDNSGTSRGAHTLSGGESFIAALALALSLAEVIQEQAGGVIIDALFIDEGFGSLDDEALSMAIDALETIENEGRMIGIISHVNELKSRIIQQLQIKTDGSGQSTIAYQTI